MKTLVFSVFVSLILVSCSGGSQKKSSDPINESTVYVYYFHGKQRCKTCMAVENITKQTITDNYNGNDKVKFVEVETDNADNTPLVEKYQIAWNALIIAQGDKHIDITNDAFATAVNSPEVLTEQIKTEVNKLIE